MYAYQLTYGFMAGDAISNHIIEIDKRLQMWGYQTGIYAQYVAPEMQHLAQSDRECLIHLNNPDTLLIYHYSAFSPNLFYYKASKNKRLVVYHNITPAHFFSGWDDKIETSCHQGRLALEYLKDCDFALADSDFNRQELILAGMPVEKTAILPIFLTQGYFDSLPIDANLRKKIKTGNTVNWLTVGRVVPNKGIHDLIRLFYIYHTNINPKSRLHIVGSAYVPLYTTALNELVTALGLQQQVIFTGRISDAQLVTYYKSSDLYLTASYHEGFCVPLIESMYYGLPILAHKSSAIPEILGGAGIMFTELGYEQVAEMAHLMISDQTLKKKITVKQKERLKHLTPELSEDALKAALERLGLATK